MKHFKWSVGNWPAFDERKPALIKRAAGLNGREHFTFELSCILQVHVTVSSGIATVSNTSSPTIGTVLAFMINAPSNIEVQPRPQRLDQDAYDMMVQAALYAIKEVLDPGNTMQEMESVKTIREAWGIQHSAPVEHLFTDRKSAFFTDEDGRVTVECDGKNYGRVDDLIVKTSMSDGEMIVGLRVAGNRDGLKFELCVDLKHLDQLANELDIDPSITGEGAGLLRQMFGSCVFLED